MTTTAKPVSATPIKSALDIEMTRLAQTLENQRSSLQKVLPSGLCAEKFIRTTLNGIYVNPQREKLLRADRRSLFMACTKAAQDGLHLDGREAVLTCFLNKKANVYQVTYMPMVQGMIKRARNSGQVKSVDAYVVYSNDEFSYNPGSGEVPVFKPDWFGDRGEPIGAYGLCKLKNGEFYVSTLSRARILKIASGGNNAAQYDPISGSHFAEWWRKTAIRAVLKYAPSASETESLVQHSESSERYTIDTETGEILEELEPPETMQSVTDRARALALESEETPLENLSEEEITAQIEAKKREYEAAQGGE